MHVEIMKEDAWVYEDKTGRLELIKKPSLDRYLFGIEVSRMRN